MDKLVQENRRLDNDNRKYLALLDDIYFFLDEKEYLPELDNDKRYHKLKKEIKDTVGLNYLEKSNE